MTSITILDRSGMGKTVEAASGDSMMEVIRDNAFDDLIALCGGCCSCATCHVYVDRAYLERLTPMSADENDLLDGASHRTDCSRLSCQIACGPELEGMTVQIAPED